MKAITFIWIMGILSAGSGLSAFTEYQQVAASEQKTFCHHCCQDGHSSTADHEEKKDSDSREDEHNFFTGCGCGCCFQMTVFEFTFTDLPGIPVLRYHFGDYTNTYQFEFTAPLFEPPRFG